MADRHYKIITFVLCEFIPESNTLTRASDAVCTALDLPDPANVNTVVEAALRSPNVMGFMASGRIDKAAEELRRILPDPISSAEAEDALNDSRITHWLKRFSEPRTTPLLDYNA